MSYHAHLLAHGKCLIDDSHPRVGGKRKSFIGKVMLERWIDVCWAATLAGLLARREHQNKGPEAWNSLTFQEAVSGLVWLVYNIGKRKNVLVWQTHRHNSCWWFSNCFACVSGHLEEMAVSLGLGPLVWCSAWWQDQAGHPWHVLPFRFWVQPLTQWVMGGLAGEVLVQGISWPWGTPAHP